MSKLDEIDNIRGNNRPSFPRRVGELGAVVQLAIADVLGTARIHAVLPQARADE